MTTSNNTGTLFQYKQYQCYYQDTLKRTSLLLLQWDNLLKLCPSKPFIYFCFTTRGTWIMKNRPILSMIQKPYQNTAGPWKKLRGRSLYANFLSLLPLYSLLIFRARIRAAFAPPWASGQNPTTGSQLLALSQDFKANFSGLCSLCHKTF